MTLRDVFDEAAAEVDAAADDEAGPDVVTAPDGSIEWGRGGVVFAGLDPAGAAGVVPARSRAGRCRPPHA